MLNGLGGVGGGGRALVRLRASRPRCWRHRLRPFVLGSLLISLTASTLDLRACFSHSASGQVFSYLGTRALRSSLLGTCCPQGTAIPCRCSFAQPPSRNEGTPPGTALQTLARHLHSQIPLILVPCPGKCAGSHRLYQHCGREHRPAFKATWRKFWNASSKDQTKLPMVCIINPADHLPPAASSKRFPRNNICSARALQPTTGPSTMPKTSQPIPPQTKMLPRSNIGRSRSEKLRSGNGLLSEPCKYWPLTERMRLRTRHGCWSG